MIRIQHLFKASLLVLGLSVLGGSPSGCSSPEATELVVGVSTQVEVPRELQTVRLDVLADDTLIFCANYEVFNSRVQLPKTLGLRKEDLDRTITVAIYGFEQPQAALPLDCGKAPRINDLQTPGLTPEQQATAARVLRRSTQPYINGRILYIPMPLKYACFDRECAETGSDGKPLTCKAGKCVSAEIDPSKLRDYQDGFTNGDASTCFRLQDCMFGAGATPMTVVSTNATTPGVCQYRVTGGSRTNLNVMIAYDEFVVEVLDEDREEGFFFPDPLQPDLIQLAEGLCTGAPAHKILSVVASTTCAPKSPYQPICNNGDIPLVPASSSVYVLIDPAIGGDAWSKPSGGETKSLKEQIETALALPSFSNTNVVVEVLPPSPPGTPNCTAPSGAARVTGRVTDVYKQIQTLLALAPGAAHASIPTALSRAYLAAAGNGFPEAKNVKAVVLLTNGDPEALQGCPAVPNTSKQFAEELAKLGVRTYVIPTDKNGAAYPAGAIANIVAVAGAGGTLQPGDDATNILAKGALYGGLVVSNLSGCRYERPGHITNENGAAVLKFVPVDGKDPVIPNRGTGPCTSDGWTVNTLNKASGADYIDICGASCDRVKASTTAFLAAYASASNPDALISPQPIVWAAQAK